MIPVMLLFNVNMKHDPKCREQGAILLIRFFYFEFRSSEVAMREATVVLFKTVMMIKEIGRAHV